MDKHHINEPTIVYENAVISFKNARKEINQVINMINNKKHCIKVINRSKYVQNYLKAANFLLLKNHLKTCTADYKNGKNSNSYVQEIVKIFKASGGKI